MRRETQKERHDFVVSFFLSGGFIPDIFVSQSEPESSAANPVRKRGAAK